MINSPLQLVAMCCQPGEIWLLGDGRQQPTIIPERDIHNINLCIAPDSIIVTSSIIHELDQLSIVPDISMLDLEVESALITNGKHKALPKLGRSTALGWTVYQNSNAIFRKLKAVIQQTKDIWSEINIPEALKRGRVALDYKRVERQGIPLNRRRLQSLIYEKWLHLPLIYQKLDIGEFFRAGKLNRRAMSEFIEIHYKDVWPRSQGGYRIDPSTISDMARVYGGLLEIIKNLEKFSRWQHDDIEIDSSGIHHIRFLPFSTKTGRSKTDGLSVLGLPKKLRTALLTCEDSYLVEVDISSQDLAVAAALSEDPILIEVYQQSDPYLAFAEMAGVSVYQHNKERVRSVYKMLCLAVLYGMSPLTLSKHLACSVEDSSELIKHHQNMFPVLWQWLDNQIVNAYRDQVVRTASGWQMYITDDTRLTSLMNWPIQAKGADLINLALRKAIVRGLKVGAVNHDALYVSTDSYDSAIFIAEELKACLQEAATELLPAIQLKVSTTMYGPEQSALLPDTLAELII